jgi:hypothetical protein
MKVEGGGRACDSHARRYRPAAGEVVGLAEGEGVGVGDAEAVGDDGVAAGVGLAGELPEQPAAARATATRAEMRLRMAA